MKPIKLFCVLFLLLTSCTFTQTNLPSETPHDAAFTPTAIANTPTNISLPTETAPPTTTSTPEPTPLNFSGTGNSKLDVTSWTRQPGLISYEGQSKKGYFAIVPYDENDNPMSAICTVNSFDPFKGDCLFNTDGQYATHIEVKTTDNWRIKISPLSQARMLVIPGSIEGNGNDVIVLTGGIPELATITGNLESQLFTLIPYKADGSRMISLVNTTDPYQATVNIHNGTAMIEVMAAGSWIIAVTDK